MDLSFYCESVFVEPTNTKEISLEVTGVNKRDILDLFEIEDILAHFDKGEILDAIGENFCAEHFGIEQP